MFARPALFLGLLLLATASCGRDPAPCDRCGGSGTTACGGADCVDRRIPCTGPCLRKEMPGWQPAQVHGFPDGLLWKTFVNADGSTQQVSQNHWGDVVAYEGGRWVLKGPCDVCNRTTRMPCPLCAKGKPCIRCSGTGKIRK